MPWRLPVSCLMRAAGQGITEANGMQLFFVSPGDRLLDLMKKILLLLLCLPISLYAQHDKLVEPSDGNGLLDYCAPMVDYADTGSYRNPMPDALKASWCHGYIQGTRENIEFFQIIMNKGENKGPLDICIPHEAPTIQFARVIVKWLRDHPEELHEYMLSLHMKILHQAFPCQAATK